MKNLSVILSIVALLAGCSNNEKSAVSEKMNYIVVFTDEMQFSDLSCYGGNIPTPNIDALAAEGILFMNAYTPASMCTPSRFAVLTGQFPGRCSAPSFFRDNPINEPYNIAWNSWITADKKTLPRLLSENGYVTGMAGKWHIGKIEDTSVLPVFDADDDLDDPETENKLRKQQAVYQEMVEESAGFSDARSVVWSNYDNHPVEKLKVHNFPWMAKGALSFLEDQAESAKPFFLYFAPTAVHGPNHVADLDFNVSYTPGGKDTAVLKYLLDTDALKEELAEVPANLRHRYAGVSQTDHLVGLLRNKLEELNLEKNTVILYMSDHNVEPGKATSFEKGIHVPMIIYWPGKTSGTSSEALVQNTDVFPTLLSASDIALPEDYPLDGISLLPVIEDPSKNIRPFIFAENGYTRSVSDGTCKYIALRFPAKLVEEMRSGELDHVPSYVEAWPQAHSAIAMNGFPNYFDQDQFYKLDEDPFEQHNIYESMKDSEELAVLKTALKAHLASFEHPFDLAPEPFLETEEYRKLAEKNLEFDLLSIPWLSRDHGFIKWPPETE